LKTIKKIVFSAKFISQLIFLIIISFCLNKNLFAGDNPEKKKWTISLSLNPYYDSNILKYSEKYIERFKNGEDEGRFHIHSIDDLTFGYSAGLTYSDEILGNQKTVFGVGFDSDAYTYNSIKTWYIYNIFWRQYITSSTSFFLSYSYIPGFYVRHFRDEDWVKYFGYTPETFQPYEFSKDDISVWVQHILPWKTTRARLYFSYMKYFLNQSNTEYDSEDFLYGFRIFQSLTDDLDFNIGYYYTTSDAKGFDEPVETKLTADDSDASNYEHIYFAGLDYMLPKVFSLNNDISIDVQYQRAFYTTDHYLELDPLHAGRYDYNYRFVVNYNLDLFKDFSISAYYNWIGRESSTSAEENREYVSNEKDYTQYRVGLRFNYIIKF